MNRPIRIRKCILCGSRDLILEQLLNVKDLVELYVSSFNFNILKELFGSKHIEYVKCNNCELSFFEPRYAGSGEFYEKLQLNRKVYYNSNRPEFSYSRSFINLDDKVLEIGSGSGFFAEKIKKNKYVGLEFNDKAISDAEKKGFRLIKSSIEDYSKEVKVTFDVICSFHVLEHVINPFEFINCSVKMLKKNGKLILSVPLNDSPLTNNVNHVLNLPPHHISRWNKKTFEKLSTIFNLELIECENHFIGQTSTQHYLKVHFLTKILNLLYPKNKVLIKNEKLFKIKKCTDTLINSFKLYKFIKKESMIGENITFVFKKTSN